MVEKKKSSQSKVKNVTFRIVKATLKAVLVYLLYFFLTLSLTPIFKLIPGLMGSIETFFVVFIVLMILGDLTERTIFQCFFNTARSLLVIAYLILSLGNGIINIGFENFSLTVNLAMFYTIAALLSLLGLARSMLQAINFINERAENATQP
jgi:uncharacterized ion transporter superfamily protein YfcC